MRHYFGRFAPELLNTDYGKEIWSIYETGDLHPDTKLTGIFEYDTTITELGELMAIIDDAKREEAARLERERESEG
jgi:RIO kinase 1